MEYPNFFESVKEAAIRLNSTVVMYDNNPVEILAVTDHVGDGIIRAYVRPIGLTPAERDELPNPEKISFYPPDAHELGRYLDEYIKKNPTCGIIRKRLDSPKFQKFRPYELGMYWDPPHLYYVERQPNRLTQQGLIASMLVVKRLHISGGQIGYGVDMYGPEMKRCILGEHPSPERCIEGLLDGRYANEAAAFHRHFAFLRGPINTLFLVYKDDLVGALPYSDLREVRLSKEFAYTKEVISELNVFTKVTMM